MSCPGKHCGVDDEIDVLNNQIVVWIFRFAHNFVWGQHQLNVNDYVWQTNAFLVEHVQIMTIVQLDHSNFRTIRGASVKTGIVFTDYGDIYMPGNILGPSLAQNPKFVSLFDMLKTVFKF